MKKIILFAFVSAFLLKSYGFSEKDPIKWGKVSMSEFEINSFRGDTSVPAIILCDYGRIKITNRTIYTHHKRIKINNDKGIKYSRIEIPYKFKENHDDIIELKANVYQLHNGTITKTQYKLKDSKTIDIDDNWKKIVFELPNVSPGSIIEYYSEIASLDFVKLNDWFFQAEIPTLWSEIRFDVPPPFFYLVTYQKGEFLTEDEQADFATKLQWLYDANRFKRRGQMSKQNHILYESPSKNYRVYLMNNMKKKIVMKNLPGVHNVSGYLSVKDYYPKLKFDLFESSGSLPYFYMPLLMTATDNYEAKSRREWMYSNRMTGYVQYKLDTWMEFNMKLIENERFGRQLIKHFDYMPVFEKILNNNMSEISKTEAIYQYVRKSFNWNGRYKVFADRDLAKVQEAKEAYSGEINLILIYLLRKAGLRSDPVLIRTNDLGFPETLYPVPNQFNHVIALVELNDEVYLLDATAKNEPFGKLPPNEQNTIGWRVDKDNFGWVDIKPRQIIN